MKDDEQLGDEPIEAPAKTSKLVLILLVLNLVVGGLAAFKAMTASPAAAAAVEEEKPELDVPGPLHSFEPFVVNLNDIENPRFLKVTMDTELRDDKVPELLDDAHIRFARDSVMRYLSSLTINDVMGEEAKDKIAAEVIVRLNKATAEDSFKRVLFAEFVVQ